MRSRTCGVAPEHREGLIERLEVRRAGDEDGPQRRVEVAAVTQAGNGHGLERGLNLAGPEPQAGPAQGAGEVDDVLGQPAGRQRAHPARASRVRASSSSRATCDEVIRAMSS